MGWGASGGEGRGGGVQVLRASVGGGAEEAALQRCTQTLRETQPLYTISVYLWKGAEGKGEEINGGISHPVEQQIASSCQRSFHCKAIKKTRGSVFVPPHDKPSACLYLSFRKKKEKNLTFRKRAPRLKRDGFNDAERQSDSGRVPAFRHAFIIKDSAGNIRPAHAGAAWQGRKK